MGNKKENNNITLIALIGVLIFSLMIFLIYSQYSDLTKLKDAVKNEQILLDQAESQLATLYDIKNQSNFYIEKITAYKKMIPASDDEGILLGYIESLSNSANLYFPQIRFEMHNAKDGYYEMPIKMFFRGKYSEVTAMLEMINTGTRLIAVDDIKINRDNSELAQLNMEVTARAFYR